MKRNKKISENPNIAVSDKKAGRLRRYRERLERELREQEKKRNTLFKKRVNAASEKKAPKTLRTKAYYRFAKDYPSVVSPDGFRENTPEKEKMSKRAKVILSIGCVLVFILTFVGVQTGIELSKRMPDEGGSSSVISEDEGIKACYITPSEFSEKTAEELKNSLSASGFNTAVIEFKSEYGYVYFDVGSFIGASADKKIDGAADKIKELEKSGINCIAYISCFKDSVVSSSLSGMEVLTSSGSLFMDSSGAMWLDPYSSATHDYLIGLIKKADETGFSSVMLDNVCFPTEFYLSSPVYLSFVDGNTKLGAVEAFIDKAVESVGSDKIILCCDITAYSDISVLPNEKYGGTLLGTKCLAFCLDLRQEHQYKEQLENSDKFRYVEEMPLAFILDAGTLAVKQLGEGKDAYMLYALVDGNQSDFTDYVSFAGIGNVISSSY